MEKNLTEKIVTETILTGKILSWIRNGLALVGVLALGFWLGAGRSVTAQSSEMGVQIQLAGIDPSSSLLVYHPSTNNIYIYKGATFGNSSVRCTYMFHLDQLGANIQRIPCATR